ncbi:HNH endonuclease [Leptospira noguchii]|uniref:HNH endonuclease domain protein n=1 Tax=Leptospira noguchii serovar Panama str. CZ214 TaxID=1001595 RepID=T0GTP8_9LEPT|nr:HNH endonuclease [Leptospira noguchii]EQA70731.1 HNH endonuclease domain protein [Leptospira noguchii serovar Panama str. CZ214]
MDIYKEISVKLNHNPILKSKVYFGMFIGLDENEEIFYETATQWCGLQIIEGKEIELRKPRPIVTKAYKEFFKSNVSIINSQEDFSLYLLIGGHAAIVSGLYFDIFGESSAGLPVTPFRHSWGGFTVVEAPKDAIKRKPSPKLRMQVLNRDHRRCKICGRSPEENIDIELHVHHIKPWSMGGLTVKNNLITLCKVCHDGLDPHFDQTLYDLTKTKLKTKEKVKKYRHHIASELKDSYGIR